MKNMQRSSLMAQRGSFYTGILMFAMIVFLLVCGMKIGPAYLDNNIVRSTVENMASNGELSTMTLAQVRSALQRNLLTNNIRDFDTSGVQITREGEREYVDINYEKRIHLFSNIDVVVAFSERFPKS